jgi:hypothetical protein
VWYLADISGYSGRYPSMIVAVLGEPTSPVVILRTSRKPIRPNSKSDNTASQFLFARSIAA